MSNAEDYQFEVRVQTRFLAEQSDEESGPYVFAYTIEILNVGDEPAQLLTRHWIITDAENEIQEVKGEGVVGEQPVIKPGQKFEYTSGCPLPTPVGTMKGNYTFVGQDGEQFKVPIPESVLSMPRTLH
ncbi:MAG: Co2+/Mg2+ efflux protein ApaG [Limnobacter sp.]|nr:Co2+/Mg2+ efflux protein ApaG [Limnobacter sp.]